MPRRIPCLSCNSTCEPENMTVFLGTLYLCPFCAPLAENAQARMERDLEDAKKQAEMLLMHHVASGGLVRASAAAVRSGDEDAERDRATP